MLIAIIATNVLFVLFGGADFCNQYVWEETVALEGVSTVPFYLGW